HFQPGMKSGVSALSTPGRHPRGMSWDTSWGQRGSAFGSPVMRLPSACDSRKVTGRVSGIATKANRTATCGYYCQSYSDGVACQKKGRIGLCEPGKEPTRMLRALH